LWAAARKALHKSVKAGATREWDIRGVMLKVTEDGKSALVGSRPGIVS
jgi:hypothetical protein